MKIPYLSVAIRRRLRMLDQDIKIGGLVGAMKKLAVRNASEPIRILDKQTQEILTKKPVLIVANHPHEAETLALLASLPQRKDVFMVIASLFMNLAPNADKYFIPVYVEHHAHTDTQKKNYQHESQVFFINQQL